VDAVVGHRGVEVARGIDKGRVEVKETGRGVLRELGTDPVVEGAGVVVDAVVVGGRRSREEKRKVEMKSAWSGRCAAVPGPWSLVPGPWSLVLGRACVARRSIQARFMCGS
jgi:hypothetical protein